MTRLTMAAITALTTSFLAACQGDTGFSAGDVNNEDLQGTGAYSIIPEGEILFEELIPGCTVTQYVRLDSIGEESLVISRIDTTVSGDGTFVVASTDGAVGAIEDITVPIGDSFEFTIRATLPALAEAVGELRIASNDVDTVDNRIVLRATPTTSGWDSGSADTGDPCD